jgi:hypothetical protein
VQVLRRAVRVPVPPAGLLTMTSLAGHFMRRPVRASPATGWAVSCSCGWARIVPGNKLRARNAWLAHAESG